MQHEIITFVVVTRDHPDNTPGYIEISEEFDTLREARLQLDRWREHPDEYDGPDGSLCVVKKVYRFYDYEGAGW